MARKTVAKKAEATRTDPPGPVSRNTLMLNAALEMVRKKDFQALLLYMDCLENMDELKALDFPDSLKIILVARSDSAWENALAYTKKAVRVPPVDLTRMGQIKMSVMLSFSKRFLNPGDHFLFLTGLDGAELDTMMMLDVGREYEIFQSVGQPPITEHIRRAVFEKVLTLSLQLASEGREGKSIGAIFVVGDSKEVLENTRQNIINPFKGYPEEERNILDNKMTETVKEFAAIDGAFIIKGTGTILSAGTYLLPKLVPEELPQGLGARHAAAAAITAATKSIAVTISESTSTVRIWRQGQLITEIEKAKRTIPGESTTDL